MIQEEGCGDIASLSLDKIVNVEGTLDIILEQACSKNANASSAVDVLIRLKDKAAGYTADNLALAEDPHARHILNNILVKMGHDIIPELIKRLKDKRWYMVRNVVKIIGEMGWEMGWETGEGQGVEDALKLLLINPDTDSRVRKEAIRTVSMLKGKESANLIKNSLNDSDNSVVELAAVSLGLLQDEDSVPMLIDLVDKSEEAGIKKEALRALGRIGSAKAAAFIIKVFKRKEWFAGKKDDEIKIVCAAALSEIAGSEAIKALEEGLSSSRDAVKKGTKENTAWKAALSL
ncbi:MAG: HEAT repeat domain-containing protein [Deltaproteobacteria bacterium]|nr:HEAT repeat domain-containing protein [Deltaproteobacteria bacterium]